MTDFRMMTSGASSRGAAGGGAASGAAAGAARLTGGAGALVETFVDVDRVPLERGSGALVRRGGADG
jgi:hypothetical protein